MKIRVKRLQPIQSLILEADLIQIGDQMNSLVNRAKETAEEGRGEEDTIELLNRLLDSLFLMEEDDLNSKLGDPIFENFFGNPTGRRVLENYFQYLSDRISEFRRRLEEELAKPVINEVEVQRISQQILTFVRRIHVLEKIYEFLIKKSGSDYTNEIYERIKRAQNNIADAFALKVKVPAERAKRAYYKFEQAQTEEEKMEAAKEVFSTVHTAEVITEEMSDELTDGIKEADREYSKRIDDELGSGTSDEIKSGLYINKNTASIIRRIFQFQYTNWTNEADIIREANALKVSINGFPDVSEEAKEYLSRMVDGIRESLIKAAKSKEFETSKYKGIHYDFNKKLPLYERTSLPVTGKQIADESKIMRFRRASQALMGLLFGAGEGPETEAGRAFARTGKHLHDLYAKTLNAVGKTIGKTAKGREGEMKADAFTRLFILDTSVLDQPKSRSVTEDGTAAGVAPGVTPQVPGSIGSMGPIVPPTATSLGSGDKFVSMGSSTQKKKKKKSSLVLDFANFMKEQNNQ